jgi:hypothetical protein
MGSTVVLLFQRDRARWEGALLPEVKVQLGQTIGHSIHPGHSDHTGHP